MKKINRNPFNEKLIHRYLFDRLYFGDKKIKKTLLPKKFHFSTINLIVPEKNQKGYRADLTLFFKESNDGIPVEVKWNSGSSFGENQLNYLKENNGFIISFDDTNYEGIDNIKINPNDFSNWVSLNISRLTKESLIYQAEVAEISQTSQWLVFLRGKAHNNWNKMISENKKNPFWAWRQNRRALKHVFDIQKGDKIIFILGLAKGENQAIQNNPKLDFQFSAWYEVTVTEPYYMNLDNDLGNYFEESNDLSPNKRKWPHFIDFKVNDYYEGEEINYGKRNELSKSLADSNNNGGGTPAPITNGEYLGLIDRLRLLSPK